MSNLGRLIFMGPNLSKLIKTHINILNIYSMLPNTLKYFLFCAYMTNFFEQIKFYLFVFKKFILKNRYGN